MDILDLIPLPEIPVIAPDGSEIRELRSTARGSMAHCTLLPGQVSKAVVHRTVEEIWVFLEGEGEVYRKTGDQARVDAVKPGVSLAIPTGTHFQFRCTGQTPLRFLLVTMPPWPGADEAVPVEDYWPVPPT
jgi:mannose-6-phosphate isomerase-like protein (cupin superfamily)